MSRTIPVSLQNLPSHSIFLPPPTSTPTEDDWELVHRSPEAGPSETSPGIKTSRIVMREKDLLVAVGRTLRMTTLGGGESLEMKDGTVGSYKTLTSNHLSFDIEQLVLSPNGRLLAVVGHGQVTVIVLPKTGYVGASKGELECRAFPIDEYQFSPSSSIAITKVLWHPLGEAGNSLWILTSDGKLREYDVNQPQDPTQTFTFLPSATSSSRFSAIDPLSRYATSFAFGIGKYDFGPFMVHVLMANGDVYTMGPVLPLHAELPSRYLQGLKAYTDGKSRRLRRFDDQDEEDYLAKSTQCSLRVQWVDSLIRQVKRGDEVQRSREEDEIATPSKRSSLLSPRQRRAGSEAPTSRRSSPLVEGMVRISPPHLTETGGPAPGVHRAILRQGPWVYDPAPQDVGVGTDEEEQFASDLYIGESSITSEAGEEKEEGEKEEIVVFAIAWSGGRVDVGVLTEKPEPLWITSRDQSPSSLNVPIIESILLTPSSLNPSGTSNNAPRFVQDPLYSDTLYVQHAGGVDAICVEPWLSALREEDDLLSSEVIRLVDSTGSSSKLIVGVIAMSNMTLGYGLLALASSHQLAVVELDYRLTDNLADTPLSPRRNDGERPVEEAQDTQSLLLASPLDIDRLIASIINSEDYNPRAMIRQLPDPSKPIQTVSPAHLKVLGEITSQLQARTQAIREASQAIENRLDLEIQEYQRQLKLLRECSSRITELKNSSTKSRGEQLLEKHKKLGDRLNKVLLAMSAEYRPQIGEAERKWFDELERLKGRIRGGGGSRVKGLASKAQLLEEQLSAVKPHIMSPQTPDSRDPQAAYTYGNKQLRPLEVALGARSEEIRRMIRKMDTLSMRVEEAAVNESDHD